MNPAQVIPGHRRNFDRRLEAIEAKVSGLFTMVAEDLPRAGHALLNGHGEIVRVLADRETLIDTLYLEIEDLAGRELLLQAPVACDLRFLLSVLQIVPKLERSNDLIMQIASRAGHIPVDDLTPRCRRHAEQMTELASAMWLQVADAWQHRGRPATAVLERRLDHLEALQVTLTAELSGGQIPVAATMDLTLAAHFCRRLGNHAVNVNRKMVCLTQPGAGNATP